MIRLFLYLFSILIFNVNNSKAQTFANIYKLNTPMDSIHLNCTKTFNLLFKAASIISGTHCQLNGYLFTIGYDKRRLIVYYATSDTTFRVRNIAYMTKKFKDTVCDYEMGWGGFIDIEDGWSVAFATEDVYRSGEIWRIRSNSTPGFIYKKTSYLRDYESSNDSLPDKFRKHTRYRKDYKN